MQVLKSNVSGCLKFKGIASIVYSFLIVSMFTACNKSQAPNKNILGF
jgi:hypothetical protein